MAMKEYQNRPVTADCIVINNEEILLIKREREPFMGFWAIPGGFVEITETTKECALRELKEETGIDGEIVRLVGVYDDPDRDKRFTVAVTYLIKPLTLEPKGGDDAAEAKWFNINELPKLAFDHDIQVADALKLLK